MILRCLLVEVRYRLDDRKDVFQLCYHRHGMLLLMLLESQDLSKTKIISLKHSFRSVPGFAELGTVGLSPGRISLPIMDDMIDYLKLKIYLRYAVSAKKETEHYIFLVFYTHAELQL